MNNPNRLDASQSSVLKQWMQDNSFSEQKFTFNEQQHKGSYSVITENAKIVSLKSKGVRQTDNLANLHTLRSLELSFFEDTQMTTCPTQLKHLRINAIPKKPLSLDFLTQCPEITELELFHTNIINWQGLYSLDKLQNLTIRFSSMKHFVLKQSLPQLRRLNLTDNQMTALSISSPQKQLKELFLSKNKLSVLPNLSLLEGLETLSIDSNPLMAIAENHLPYQLKNLDIRKTMILDFEPLKSLQNLQRVQVQRKPKNFPISLADKFFPAVTEDSQLAIAEDFMNNYLEGLQFIEKLPKSVNGKALGLSKESAQHFSMNGTSKLSGNITIDEIQGLMRIPLAQTDNQLFMQRQVSISGQAQIAKGVFRVYSPVKLDFWSMAAVFVDHPQPNAPASSDLELTGYFVYEALADKPVSFKANLIPMADRYFLLVGSDVATGIKINYE